MITWEAAPYEGFKNGRVADVNGIRLRVKRSEPRKQSFTGFINGRTVGCWNNIDMACSQVAKIYLESNPI